MDAGKIRMLVVDDEAFVRDMVGFVLEAAGYEVDTAENGREALEKFGKGPAFHVAVTDMNMPEMDGPALIRELKKKYPETAIVLMTGDADAPEAGADACVLKDADIQEAIVSVVEDVARKTWLKD